MALVFRKLPGMGPDLTKTKHGNYCTFNTLLLVRSHSGLGFLLAASMSTFSSSERQIPVKLWNSGFLQTLVYRCSIVMHCAIFLYMLIYDIYIYLANFKNGLCQNHFFPVVTLGFGRMKATVKEAKRPTAPRTKKTCSLVFLDTPIFW